MRKSQLNSRCRVEYKVITKDATYGSAVESWVLLGVRFCELQDAIPSRSETQREGLITSARQTRLRMNYCTDITSDMRIVVNRPARQVYQIIAGPAILGDKEEVEFVIEKIDG